MTWKYKKTEVNGISEMPEGTIGFIYKIRNLKTGEYYIGKKNLFTNRKRRFGKKEIALLKDKRLKRYETIKKESNWKTYRSSNPDVKKWRDEDIYLKILKFCKTNKGLTYYEAEYQFYYNVLGDKMSMNDNISGKFFRKDLEMMDDQK